MIIIMMGLRLRTGVGANDLQDHIMSTVSPSRFCDGFSIGLHEQTTPSGRVGLQMQPGGRPAIIPRSIRGGYVCTCTRTHLRVSITAGLPTYPENGRLTDQPTVSPLARLPTHQQYEIPKK